MNNQTLKALLQKMLPGLSPGQVLFELDCLAVRNDPQAIAQAALQYARQYKPEFVEPLTKLLAG